MVLPDSDRVPRVPPYSGTCSQPTNISSKGLSPSMAELSSSLQLCSSVHFIAGPTTPAEQVDRFGLFPVRSPLLRESRLMSFPRGTKMFQLPRFALLAEYQPKLVGFPIQEFPDRSLVSGSPKLIAAILRLSSPLNAKASSVCS